MDDLIEAQWQVAHLINDLLKTRGEVPVFVGYFAKLAITRTLIGVTKDIDSFVFDENSGIPKGPEEQQDLADYLVIELQKQSFDAEVRMEYYAVHLIVRSRSRDVIVELLFPAEGIQPDSDHLNRSFTFRGLQFISPEDWIVMKLEAIRDRTEEKGRKHKNDLIEIANFLQRTGRKVDFTIISSEIKKREGRKHNDMFSTFLEIFTDYVENIN